MGHPSRYPEEFLFEYIETFYNRQRHQAQLGHRTPAALYAEDAA